MAGDGRLVEPDAEAAAGEQSHPLRQPLDRAELLADDERSERVVDDHRQHAGERARIGASASL